MARLLLFLRPTGGTAMSLKLSVPITIRIPSGTWAGFVRRIDSQLDLLVESSGSFKVGESGTFDMEIADVPGRIEGLVRVVKAGDRTGPFTRYIFRISKVTSRNARQFHSWLREHPRAAAGRSLHESSPDSHGAGDTIPPNYIANAGPRIFPKRPVDVDVPITMRLERGLAAGTMRRFQGQRFAVEAEEVVVQGSEIFFQFGIPTYNTVVYGTATVEQEVATYGRSHFYVMHIQKMRDSDRDLMLGWLHEIAPDDAFVDSDAITRPDISDVGRSGTPLPSTPPSNELARHLGPDSRTDPGGGDRPGSDLRPSEGRRSLREVLRGFFSRSAAPAAKAGPQEAGVPASPPLERLPEGEEPYDDEEYDDEDEGEEYDDEEYDEEYDDEEPYEEEQPPGRPRR